jgi:hypothetical protein
VLNQLSDQVKNSTFGGPSPTGASFSPTAPSNAVGYLTPQVQATKPPIQPGQMPQPMTAAPSMPKMGQYSNVTIHQFAGFSDELEAILKSYRNA